MNSIYVKMHTIDHDQLTSVEDPTGSVIMDLCSHDPDDSIHGFEILAPVSILVNGRPVWEA